MIEEFQYYCLDGIVRIRDLNKNGSLGIIINTQRVVDVMNERFPHYKKIICKGSLGYWDEVVVKDKKFIGFNNLETQNEQKAVRRVLEIEK